KLLKRHHLERCLIRAGLLQHKNNESKTPGQSQGFVSSLSRRFRAGFFALSDRQDPKKGFRIAPEALFAFQAVLPMALSRWRNTGRRSSR
ncbi:hypothetical protein LC092_19790, partial [Stappia stellulata]|uniref:hypothetical protein n=1 Tax=Stappia stellulata TaxID=71235 RepID=UPI001CD4C1A1